MAHADERLVAMTTQRSTKTDASEAQRSFYLPAVPSLSGGRLERLSTRIHDRNRRLLRDLE